jgi:C4-dicarboxylate-specific signal transduction histidine kinase
MQLQLLHTPRLAVMGELAAGIAHEVNQPLCAIVNFAKACQNVATREPHDLDQLRQWLGAISTAAGRAGDIVRRLLGFARLEAAASEHVPARQLIDDALLLVRHEARSHQVAVEVDAAREDLVVVAAPVRIQQVLVNLLRNGIEALSAAPADRKKIAVRAARVADGVEISVADNGTGIPDDELQRVFQPFYTTKPQGLGLGLAISRTIIEDHGGRIEARPNASGGLTFRFTLPVPETPGRE